MRIGKKEISRREFLKLAGAGLLYLTYESIAFKITAEKAKELSVFHHIIKIPNLDKKWDGTFIVHFSDMHLSERGVDFINPQIIAEYSKELTGYLKVIGAHPEKTVLIDTGDLVSAHMGNGLPTPLSVVEESLGYIANIPVLGKFFVAGNHEFHHPGKSDIFTIVEQQGYVQLGFEEQQRYLFDSNSLPFTLAFLPDFTVHENHWYESSNADNFLLELKNRDMSKPMVLATHTSLYDSWRGGVMQGLVENTLFLHGHTHGGQVGPYTPLQNLASKYAIYGRLQQKSKYYRGVSAVENGNIISVSPGLGHSSLHHTRTMKPGGVIYEFWSS